MKKMKMFGMKREHGRTEFILEKSDKFIVVARKAIEDIVGSDFRPYLFMCTDESGEKIDIKYFDDRCEFYEHGDLKVEVFVGKNRVIMVVWSSADLQEKFIKKIRDSYDLVKYKGPKKSRKIKQVRVKR